MPESLEVIERMEDYLGRDVVRVKAGRGLDY